MKKCRQITLALLGVLTLFCLSRTDASSQDLATTAYKPTHSNITSNPFQDFYKPLNDVMEELKSKKGIYFVFEVKSMKEKLVDSRFDAKKHIDSILTQLLTPVGLTFKKVRNVFIIVDRSENKTKRLETIDAVTPTSQLYEAKHLILNPALRILPSREIVVTGKVLSDTKEGLPGVNVILKGTAIGTTTNAEGNYSLSLPDGNGTLVFSYIGYTTEEVPVNNRTTIDVSLMPDIQSLSEVVVVGYGLVKKQDVIGSVSSVSAKELNTSRNVRIEQALQGKVSGVQVTSSSGVPGADVRVLIRGISTISASANPLWVVDGIPVTDIANLNPNDISSIEVLKDAGATSIYGSRGSNGVIIITTKSAGKNERNFSVNYNTGVSTLTKTPRQMGIASTAEYFKIVDEARANAGFGPGVPNDIMAFNMSNIKGPFTPISREEAENTNINFDDLYRNASFADLNISNSAGFEKGSLFLSFNYRDDKGVEHNNGLKRYSLRLNADVEPFSNLKVGTRFNLSYLKNDHSTNYFNGMVNNRLPWYPLYNSSDPTGYWNPFKNLSPITYSSEHRVNRTNEYRGLGGVFAQYNIPFIKGLFVRSELNVDMSFNSFKDWSSDVISERGSYAYELQGRRSNVLYNAYAGYSNTFADHTLTFTLGAERQSIKHYNTELTGTNLTSIFPEYGTNPQQINHTFSGISFERYLGAYFGRAGYKFKDRYLIEGSFRRDGSSAFTKDYRYGNFASVAAGWIMSNESFFKNLGFVNFLKIRGSIGQTGNQQIPSGISQPIWRSDAGNWGGIDYSGRGGQRQVNIVNPKATWETTTSFDGGLDFGLLESRISGSVAYYNRDVSGLLLELSLPYSAGVEDNIWSNVGRIKSRGIELELHSVNLDTNGFKWTSSFNITTSKNKVANLSEELDLNNSGILFKPDYLTNDISTITKTGLPIGQYYMAEFAYVDPAEPVHKGMVGALRDKDLHVHAPPGRVCEGLPVGGARDEVGGE